MGALVDFGRTALQFGGSRCPRQALMPISFANVPSIWWLGPLCARVNRAAPLGACRKATKTSVNTPWLPTVTDDKTLNKFDLGVARLAPQVDPACQELRSAIQNNNKTICCCENRFLFVFWQRYTWRRPANQFSHDVVVYSTDAIGFVYVVLKSLR